MGDPTEPGAPPQPPTCDSCGAVESDLAFVQRVYVTPESWDTPEKVTDGDLEWWCFVCRTHYPHRPPTAA